MLIMSCSSKSGWEDGAVGGPKVQDPSSEYRCELELGVFMGVHVSHLHILALHPLL